mmetsp:Transcript_3406/g.6896  ORF Transcript_3406/g.6896 Transcript_3406/m.6896 type:complete len:82 (-) Transcript_3406:486-731(-)
MLEKRLKNALTRTFIQNIKYGFCARFPFSIVTNPKTPPKAIIVVRRKILMMLTLMVGLRQIATAIGALNGIHWIKYFAICT